jgi:uncharacterized coiled-coil DUF342 family protein
MIETALIVAIAAGIYLAVLAYKLNEKVNKYKGRAIDAQAHISTLGGELQNIGRKLRQAHAEIDNLQAALAKSKKNDTPKDPKTGKFKKK